MKKQPVLVLGAGINGASVARELALNGVPCWVIDQRDIAFGATSKSSRLIHGGLRYLEYGEFRLVREALVERDRLLRLAPQFVKPLTFAVPIRQRGGGWTAAIRRLVGLQAAHASPRGLWLTRAGLRMYDWFSRNSPLPSHTVSRRHDNMTPQVAEAYRWVCRYSDAQMQFPERYTLALLRDAAQISAEAGLDFRVLTHHEVRRTGTTFRLVDARETRPAGESPREVTCEPPLIVNATGAWGDATLSELQVPTRRLFGGTKGSHFLIASLALRDALGDFAVYAETADGRFVFVLPFGPHVLVGTTDEPFSDDPHQAVARQDELDYLFELVHAVFPSVPLQRDQIVCHYSGVRPLPFAEDQAPGAVSRDHHVELTEGDIRVLTLIGGKLTTSRQLGEQVADMVFEKIGCTRSASTRERVVPGGSKFPADSKALAERHTQLAHQLDCDASTIECLDALGGNLFEELFQRLPPHERTLVEGTHIPRGIVRWIIQNEWVRCLPDLVERRLMLVLTGQLTERTLSDLGQLLVEENVIDAADLQEQLTTYRRRLTEKYGCRW